MEFYVYIYYDPSRNKEPIYVGKGKKNRAWVHLSRDDRHPFVNRLKLISENGYEPIIGIYGGLDNELSSLVEEELISKFGRKDLNKGPLLNLTDGGEGVINPSEELRFKMGSAKRGKKDSEETKNKRSKSLQGHIVTKETRDKQSSKKKGKIPSAVYLRRSYAGIGNPQFGKTWSNDKKNKMSATNKGRKREYRDDGTFYYVYPHLLNKELQ